MFFGLDKFFIFESFLFILNLFLFNNFLFKDETIKTFLYVSEFKLELDLNVDESKNHLKSFFVRFLIL